MTSPTLDAGEARPYTTAERDALYALAESPRYLPAVDGPALDVVEALARAGLVILGEQTVIIDETERRAIYARLSAVGWFLASRAASEAAAASFAEQEAVEREIASCLRDGLLTFASIDPDGTANYAVTEAGEARKVFQ